MCIHSDPEDSFPGVKGASHCAEEVASGMESQEIVSFTSPYPESAISTPWVSITFHLSLYLPNSVPPDSTDITFPSCKNEDLPVSHKSLLKE